MGTHLAKSIPLAMRRLQDRLHRHPLGKPRRSSAPLPSPTNQPPPQYDGAWNTEYFKQHIRAARAVANGRPIWITEFGPQGSDAEVEVFLKDVLPWLDAQSDVHRYAMQMAAPGSLVSSGGNALSAVGNVYNTY